jgi:hypothetical protein
VEGAIIEIVLEVAASIVSKHHGFNADTNVSQFVGLSPRHATDIALSWNLGMLRCFNGVKILTFHRMWTMLASRHASCPSLQPVQQ